MRIDSKGDMGFLEAVLSAMAVVTVLMAFIGTVSTALVASEVSMDGFDTRMLDAEISEGVFVPYYLDYMQDCMDVHGYSSVTVSVSVPGGFCEDPGTVTVGEPGGFKRTLFHTDTVECDSGRTVPVFYEVELCKTIAGE
ncbi:MAG: hypothetical protein IKD00_06605 [Candidatus Methanomethylophilaceae archaeon]|nr:hypothetical protein [Candidatus Methanomethylophilaceae archaeon]